MSSSNLTLRQINRATLARQMLLERQAVSPLEAVETLAGLQAQEATPPFLALWTRIANFERDHLMKPLREHRILRATAMRGTLHLLSVKDFLSFRPLLQPMLTGGLKVLGKRGEGLNIPVLAKHGEEFFSKGPAVFEDFRGHLGTLYPDADLRAMAYAVRLHLHLIQVPDDSVWGYAKDPKFSLLASKVKAKPTPFTTEEFVLRYLAAYGPATAADMQTWSAMKGLGPVLKAMKSKLAVFRDEAGRELFDLPDAPRPSEDTPVPVRFLPEFDSLMIAHDDRTRLIDDAHRPLLVTKNLRVRATFLVDGFVKGFWKFSSGKSKAVLELEPLEKLTKKMKAELEAEGEKLLRFAEPEAPVFEIKMSG